MAKYVCYIQILVNQNLINRYILLEFILVLVINIIATQTEITFIVKILQAEGYHKTCLQLFLTLFPKIVYFKFFCTSLSKLK